MNARLVTKLLRAKAKREDVPADELVNRDIDPDKVWRLLGLCELMTLLDLFGRHAKGYALSADEKTTQGCAAKSVHDYIP